MSAGVFTVLFVVGLIPRFAGRTDTARCELFYEECLVFGAILADGLSIYPIRGSLGELTAQMAHANVLLTAILVLIGTFAGIFVGSLAMAIAEMLDSIPIFTRRVGFRHGLGIVVLAMALGKMTGSFVYFWKQIFMFGG